MGCSIMGINKETFFKKDHNIFKVRDSLLDLYNEIDSLNERLKKLEEK